MAKAILEDPSVFDYDSHVYGNTEKPQAARPQSRYIGKLVKANEVRSIEQTAAWDRMESK